MADDIQRAGRDSGFGPSGSRGTEHNEESNEAGELDLDPDVVRTGRASYLQESGTRGTQFNEEPNEAAESDLDPSVVRAGRPSAFGANPAQSAGLSTGADDGTGDPTSRIADGVGAPFPTP